MIITTPTTKYNDRWLYSRGLSYGILGFSLLGAHNGSVASNFPN